MNIWKSLRGEISWLQQSEFARHVGESLLARIIGLILGTAISILTARLLGPEGRGEYAIVGTIAMLGVQFGNFGLPAANTYLIARDKNRLPELLGNSILISLVFGLIISMIAYAVTRFFPDLCTIRIELLNLALIGIPLGIICLLFQNLSLGLQQYRTYNLSEIIQRMVQLALICTLIHFTFISSFNFYGAGIVAQTLGSIFLLVLLLKQSQGTRVSWPVLKESLGYGTRSYLCCVLSYIASRSNLLIGQQYLEKHEIGNYAVALSIVDLLALFPITLGSLLFPKLAGISDSKERWRLTQKTAIRTLLFMVGASTICWVASSWIINILYGASFLPAGELIPYLLPGQIALAVSGVYSSFIGSTVIPWSMVILNLASGLVGTLLCYLMIHSTHSKAMPIAVSAAACLLALGSSWIATSMANEQSE